jgi:hypothetical protein
MKVQVHSITLHREVSTSFVKGNGLAEPLYHTHVVAIVSMVEREALRAYFP